MSKRNVIAVIWDFDKTLIKDYMQQPIFDEFNVDAKTFWREVNELPDKYQKEQDVKVNKDTIYLNHFLKYVRDGIFEGMTNEKLKSYGGKLHFYDGVEDIFSKTQDLLKDREYMELDIKVEHYIVSTGFAQVIKGSSIMEQVKKVWGCELIAGENGVVSEIGYTIDNTSKTRAIFEINKGEEVDVNSKVPEIDRRVDFKNMLYIADGPSDVPAFSVVKGRGGATFAIYPKQDEKAFEQVERLREDGRIDMFAEADYREGTTANMWICFKIKEMADRIVAEDKARRGVRGVPRHLTE